MEFAGLSILPPESIPDKSRQGHLSDFSRFLNSAGFRSAAQSYSFKSEKKCCAEITVMHKS